MSIKKQKGKTSIRPGGISKGPSSILLIIPIEYNMNDQYLAIIYMTY